MTVREENPARTGRLLGGGCAIAIVAAIGLSVCSCRDQGDPKPPASRASVVVSGDTAGWIVPCGCTSHQSGGLLRRGTYVNSLHSGADVVVLDAGGAPGGASVYQRVKFEAILRGEKLMGIAAHNIGGPELALGIDYLREAARSTGVTLLSANLKDAGGQPAFEASTLAQAAGLGLIIVGVLSPRYAAGNMRIDEPKASILAALRSGQGGYDRAIVLAYMPEDELVRLAAELPEVDAVIGGPTGQAVPPRAAGPVTVAAATNKGKFLVQLDFARDSKGAAPAGRIVEVTGDYADDPAQSANLERYLDQLEREDFTPDETGLVQALPGDTPAEYRIAGSASCLECHPKDDELWKPSRHAHAWSDLKQTGRHVDSYCQQCHTTGYGLPGGFVSAGRSGDRVDVGCESCHGPSQAHVENPDRQTPFDAKDQCVRCHDLENSPRFAYDLYWDKIKHGETPGIQPDQSGTRPATTEAQP